ncbi:NAD-dependent epimerase/dehydratase family protein [Stenotrophomonas bentonitica]
MRLLITGATSGLGRVAAETMLAEGIEVRATGRDPVAGAALRSMGAEFIAADLPTLPREAWHRLLSGMDVVWHCAALSSPWGSSADFHAINVVATQELLDAAGECGVARFVHVSTPGLYFDRRHHLDVEESWRATRFANDYVYTKALAEDAVQASTLRYPHTRFVILRPRALFGPHDRAVLPRLMHLVRRGHGVLWLPRGGAALQDVTYTGNVVHAMRLAGTADVASGRVYNITNQQPIRLCDLIVGLFSGLQERIDIRPVPYALLRGLASAMELTSAMTGREPLLTRYGAGVLNFDMTLSARLAQQELGYLPPISLDTGVALAADWFLCNGHDKSI